MAFVPVMRALDLSDLAGKMLSVDIHETPIGLALSIVALILAPFVAAGPAATRKHHA